MNTLLPHYASNHAKASSKTSALENSNTGTERLKQWDKTDLSQYPAIPNPSKSLQANINLTRKNWCGLNRARCRVGQSKQNLNMWKIIQNPTCDLGQEQTMGHFLF